MSLKDNSGTEAYEERRRVGQYELTYYRGRFEHPRLNSGEPLPLVEEWSIRVADSDCECEGFLGFWGTRQGALDHLRQLLADTHQAIKEFMTLDQEKR